MNGNTNMNASAGQPTTNVPKHIADDLVRKARQHARDHLVALSQQQRYNLYTSFLAKCRDDAHRAALQARHGDGLLSWFIINWRYSEEVKRYRAENVRGQGGTAQTGAPDIVTPTAHNQQTVQGSAATTQGAANYTPQGGVQQTFTQAQGQSLHTPSPVVNAAIGTPQSMNSSYGGSTKFPSQAGAHGAHNTNLDPTPPLQPLQQPLSQTRSAHGLGLHDQQQPQGRAAAAFGTSSMSSFQPQPSRTFMITASPEEAQARAILANGLTAGIAASGNLCAQHLIVAGEMQMQNNIALHSKIKETFSKYTAYLPVCTTCRVQEVTDAVQKANGPAQMPNYGAIDTCTCASHITTFCPFCDLARIDRQKNSATMQRQGPEADPAPRLRCHCGRPAEYEEVLRKCVGCGGISTQPTNCAGERVKFYAATDVVASVGNRGRNVSQYVQPSPQQVQAASRSGMTPMQKTPSMMAGKGSSQPSNKRKLDHDQTEGPSLKRRMQQPIPQQPTPQHQLSQSAHPQLRNAQIGGQSAGPAPFNQIPTPQLKTSTAPSPAVYSSYIDSSQIDSPATPVKKEKAPRQKKSTAAQVASQSPAGKDGPQKQQPLPPGHRPLLLPETMQKLAYVLGFTVQPHTIDMRDLDTSFHVLVTLLVDNHHNTIEHSNWMSALGLIGISGVEMGYPKPQKDAPSLTGGQILDNLRDMGFMHTGQAQTKIGANCGYCRRQHAVKQDVTPLDHVSPPASFLLDPSMPSPESSQGRKSSASRSANIVASQNAEIIDLSSPVSSPKVPTPEKARAAQSDLPDNAHVNEDDWEKWMQYDDDNATAAPNSDGPWEFRQHAAMQQPLVQDTTADCGVNNHRRSLADIESSLFAAFEEQKTQELAAGTATVQAPGIPATADDVYAGYYPVGDVRSSTGLAHPIDPALAAEIQEQLRKHNAPLDEQALPATVGQELNPSAEQGASTTTGAQSAELSKESHEPVACDATEAGDTTDGASVNTTSAANTTATTEQSTSPTTAAEETTGAEKKQDSTSPPSVGPQPDFLPRVLTPEEQAQADSIGTFLDFGDDEPISTGDSNGNLEWEDWPPREEGVPTEENELPERPEGIMSLEVWQELSSEIENDPDHLFE